MQGLLAIASKIDAVTKRIGEFTGWLIVAAVVISAGNAIIRKVFDSSSNAWLELQWYLFGGVFMLCAAWTLQRREHIKVDLLYNMMSQRGKQGVTIFGHLFFLLPYVIVAVVLTGPVFWKSFASGEMSGNAGGLIIWPAKFILFFGFVLLLIQAISEIIKQVAIMRGLLPDPDQHGHGHGHSG